jgi:hypothetical protein
MDQGYTPIAIHDEDGDKVSSVKVDNRDPVALIDAVAAREKGCDVAVEAARGSSLRLGIEGNEVAKLQGRMRRHRSHTSRTGQDLIPEEAVARRMGHRTRHLPPQSTRRPNRRVRLRRTTDQHATTTPRHVRLAERPRPRQTSQPVMGRGIVTARRPPIGGPPRIDSPTGSLVQVHVSTCAIGCCHPTLHPRSYRSMDLDLCSRV